MPEDTILKLRGVTRRYGHITALTDIDLDICGGEAVVLLGHNGAGKTTLVRIAAGYQEPWDGLVRVMGRNPHDPGDFEIRSQIAFVADVPSLYDDLTVAEHIDLLALAYGVEDAERRRDELIEELGLERHVDFFPGQLSRGLRQKTQLASTFVRPFSLLILDEPSAGLDPPAQERLKARLGRHRDDGCAVLFTTHELDLAHGLADRAVVLEDGAIAADGKFGTISREWLAGLTTR